ncbi:MAG TPA: amidase [Candidatus Limnocylindria bacterium]|nr:amidase [Candidatus Limnocylindria bacterium]
MSESAVADLTLSDVAEAVRLRKVSAVEVTQACLDRIARFDPALRAFITVDADGALAAAKAADAAPAPRGPLHGVPVAFKDLCHVRGLPTSCGTKTAEYFSADPECTAVARLRAAGAIVLGKLNMSELALGPFGDNAHHGDVQNPWKPGYAAGGSSSGSAAAVAARLAFGALGSDTGGSIRLPAACCGIVGLKPTYGRVSRAGAMALSWSVDHLGPMTRTVRDAALMLGVIAGHDPRDATSSRRPVGDFLTALDRPLAGVRVGIPDNYYFDGVAADVETAARVAAGTLESAGARVHTLRIPDPAIMADVSNILARCESAVVHARVARERPHELQPAVRGRLEVGFHVSAFDYLQAARLRARLAREFVTEVFAEVDVLLAPAIPAPAPRLDDAKAGTVDAVMTRMARFSRLTRPFNGLGLPALSLPCGWSAAGLPLAVQVIGRPFDEARVLAVSAAIEREGAQHARRPPLS